MNSEFESENYKNKLRRILGKNIVLKKTSFNFEKLDDNDLFTNINIPSLTGKKSREKKIHLRNRNSNSYDNYSKGIVVFNKK